MPGPGKKLGRPPAPPRGEDVILQAAGTEVVPLANARMEHARAKQPPRYEYAPIKTLADGESPADIMLAEARYHYDRVLLELGRKRPSHKRISEAFIAAREAAKAAAPYVHTKLAAMRFTGEVDVNNTWNVQLLMAAVAKLPDAEIEQFERLFRLIAAAAGASAPGAESDRAGTNAASH